MLAASQLPCAVARSTWLCCQSFSARAWALYRSCVRASLVCAMRNWAWAVRSVATAAIRSFCACTNSLAWMANSGWPCLHDVAGLGEHAG